MTQKQFQKIAEGLGWNVTFDGTEIDLQQYTSAGQDFFFSIRDSGNYAEEVYLYYVNYDPSEEALKWVDDSGHGKNGAPYYLRDIIIDMEEVEQMLKELYEALLLDRN